MVNNAFIEPGLKRQVELLLSKAGIAFNDFINGLLLEYIEEHNSKNVKNDANFDEIKFQEEISKLPPPPFAIETKEQLEEALEAAFRDVEEGRLYTEEEVNEMLFREYGIHV